jgi:hypothetical protein
MRQDDRLTAAVDLEAEFDIAELHAIHGTPPANSTA